MDCPQRLESSALSNGKERQIQSEEFLRLALDAVQMGVWAWDMTTDRITWSDGVEALFGLQPGEFIGTYEAYLNLIYPRDRDQVIAKIEQALTRSDENFHTEHRILCPNGQLRWLEGKGRVSRDKTGKPIRMAGTVIDITSRIQAEQALQESETRFRTMTEAALEGLVITDHGVVLDINDQLATMLGYHRAELIEQPALNMVAPQSRDLVMANMQSGNEGPYEHLALRKNGEVFPVEVQAKAIPYHGRTVRVTAIRDVSGRRAAETERERLIEELEARNAELERFTYTVSHDLKTPIISIMGFVGLLEKDVREGNRTRFESDLNFIHTATEKMHQLLEDLLELSRVGRIVNASEPVSLSELAEEAADLLIGSISQRGVSIHIAPDLPTVFGDRVRLREAFQNLIDNAVKFMGDQPNPQIAIDLRKDDDVQVVFVSDNGIGIEPSYHSRVFELFERLTPDIEGTGVGLALVKRIIEHHGGAIWIESEGMRQGTTICLTLPETPMPQESDHFHSRGDAHALS